VVAFLAGAFGCRNLLWCFFCNHLWTSSKVICCITSLLNSILILPLVITERPQRAFLTKMPSSSQLWSTLSMFWILSSIKASISCCDKLSKLYFCSH
jgi:hypothetical protein